MFYSGYDAGGMRHRHYLFKVINNNTRKTCEICSKLTIATLEKRQWCCPFVFIVNFEHISRIFLLFLLLILIMYLFAGEQYTKWLGEFNWHRFGVTIFNLEHIWHNIQDIKVFIYNIENVFACSDNIWVNKNLFKSLIIDQCKGMYDGLLTWKL